MPIRRMKINKVAADKVLILIVAYPTRYQNRSTNSRWDRIGILTTEPSIHCLEHENEKSLSTTVYAQVGVVIV